MKNIAAYQNFNSALENCIENGNCVNVYFIINGMTTIRNNIFPCEVIVDENQIYIESNNDTVIDLKDEIEEIEYDEMENSYHIKENNLDVYFDFI